MQDGAGICSGACCIICCISNFSDFWRITSLSLPYDYKEVTVFKLEPLQLQLMEKVLQTLLN